MKFIRIISFILISIFTMKVFSASDSESEPDLKDISFSIVVYQGNCTSQAVMYQLDEYKTVKTVKIVAQATVNSISNENILGKNCNLKFNDGSVSMLDLCLQYLKDDFNNKDTGVNQDEIINIDSVIIGIAGYNVYKHKIYNNQITKLVNFKDSLIYSMQSYNFNCSDEKIKIMHNINLINASSIQLVKNNIIVADLKDTNFENIWTFCLSSLTFGIKSSKQADQYILDDICLYLGNSKGGYYNLGKKSSVLFEDIVDEKSAPTNQIQKLISDSDLGKEIMNKRGQTFAYWLKENYEKSTLRNNARGLAVLKYALSISNLLESKNKLEKPLVKIESDTPNNFEDKNLAKNLYKLTLENQLDTEIYTDASVNNLKVYVLNLINNSIDLLVKSIANSEKNSSPNDKSKPLPCNDIILVAGDLFNYDFVRINYEKILNERITNLDLRSRIKLVTMDNFILGLALASEALK